MTLPMQYCEVCETELLPRPRERRWDYQRRRSCSAACVTRLQSRLRGNPVRSAEAFWAGLLPEGACLVWTGPRDKGGYGRATFQRRQWSTSRLAYTLAKGPIPAGLQVRHTCDNPPCCSPEHLQVGSLQDNEMDKRVRGRTWMSGRSGEANSQAKLSDLQVAEIRRLYALGGTSHAALSLRFGIAKVNVWKILSGRRWRHLL